jgi:DNA-binding transcriptional ArsR family regulator
MELRLIMKQYEDNEDGKFCCDQIENLKNIISEMPDENEIQKQANKIKSLGDPTRLKIIYLLESGELCVCEIMEALEKPQPTVSHHLNLLKNAGLLKWRKQGVWTHYKLSDPKIIVNLKKLINK